MTRDEAIRIYEKAVPFSTKAGHFIDLYIALGILKVEEPASPQTPTDKFAEAFRAMDVADRRYLMQVLGVIKNAGLKIVEA